MNSKASFWSRYGMPISLIFWGIVFLGWTWRAQSTGKDVVYWNRGAPIAPQALYFAAGGFIVVGVLLFILRRGHE